MLGLIYIYVCSFWGQWQVAFFDARVFHPNAPSYHHSSIPSVYRHHDLQKKREYGERVREAEQFLLPLAQPVYGMGKEELIFYHCWLSHQGSMSHSSTLAWIRCTLSFSFVRSAAMCIWGTIAVYHKSIIVHRLTVFSNWVTYL